LLIKNWRGYRRKNSWHNVRHHPQTYLEKLRNEPKTFLIQTFGDKLNYRKVIIMLYHKRTAVTYCLFWLCNFMAKCNFISIQKRKLVPALVASYPGRFTPRKEPVPSEKEARWVPKPVWIL
jgi:hypothetical protein